MRRLFVVVLCMCLGAGVLHAQGVTTGAVSGVVDDPNGDPLPGVTVQAVLETTGTRYSTITDGMGRYSILNMKVGGPYRITASLQGFQDQAKTDVYVRLGETLGVPFQLQLEAVEAEVVVVSEADPLISPTRMGVASNVSTQEIESLPTIDRGLQDFARTNPLIAVIPDQDESSTISVMGRNARYNSVQIDGAVNTDVFGLPASASPGGQAETQPISLDAIQELQLVVSPYDVRQGGFSGGGINAITRSGTNAFRGSVYGYFRDDSLVGDGPDDFPELGTFEESQYGFRLGGPIMRDKSFFFVSGEMNRLDRPTGWSIDGQAGQQYLNGTVVEEAQRFLDILQSQYGYNAGGLSQQTRYTDSDKLFVRGDFNLSDNHNLTVRHNYIDAKNLINRPDYDTYQFPNNAYDFQNETNSTVAQLNSVLGDNMFNLARLTYQTIKDRRHGVGEDFPYIRIEDVDGDGNWFEAGTEPYSTANSLDQDVIEFTDDFTWITGDHEITIGTHNEFFSFKNLFLQDHFGSYRFEDLDAFEAGIAGQYDHTYSADADPYDSFDVQQLGFYAGDTWRVKPNVTLNLGLRVDIPLFPDTPQYNPLVEEDFGYRTDEVPDGNMMWSPRLGFNWDIAGDGSKQLRGGVGLFSGRTPYVWISNNYGRTGIEQVTIRAYGDIPFNPDPNDQPTNIGGASSQDINVVDPDFEFPQVWRYNLAYDHRLPWWDLVATVEAVYADVKQDIDYENLNMVQTGETLFDGRPIYTTVDRTFSGAYLLKNTSKGEQTNYILKLEKPYREGWWGYVAYTYGDATVVNDGTSSRAVSNFQYTEAPDPNNAPESTSDFEVKHRFSAALSYQFNRDSKWATTLSMYYNHQAGRPYTAIFATPYGSGGSVNNDYYFYNDPIYVPSGPDDVIITNGTWDQLNSWIESNGLGDYKGKIAPRNASRAPWTETLDLHVGQEIPVGYGNFELTLDILNFMNLLDSDAGHVRFVPFGTVTPITYLGTDEDSGLPMYQLRREVTDPENYSPFVLDNLRSRWQAKLGIRYSF